MNYNDIHNDFRLNGDYLDKNKLIELASKLVKSEEIYEQDFGSLIFQWFDEKDFILLTTSGTTGTPKQIKLQKQAVINSAKATGIHFDLKPKDAALLCLPTKYIAGKLMFVRALVLGLHLDVVNPSSNPLENISKTYDFVAMVPLQVLNSIEKLHLIKKLIVGGAKLDRKIKEQILSLNSHCQVYETYGMTETITHIAAKKISEVFFTALPHAKISVDNRGCLVIDAPSVNSEKLITNDLVELKEPNQFKWLGRVDNVINSGGIKLFPEQIEEKLTPFINNRFFVIGKEDDILGNKLVLIIESEPYVIEPEIFDILSTFEKPKEIQFVTKFKETATGKILRKDNLR
ncbi:O-succinylbenzoic acid--CoA ligase [Paenimyroides tangerinum]|uniref:O-succinylbenzoic acid--CoA ligase n=1 Tax=Paenimyroides tangerinum TaxID=2488728 RepID=A0A3P3WC04_9FLAO|nr:AMP-binding protein [Paenimyroides tangerinum]RRJ90143.1 O-succinylbenzoic acid--CoA ligase [Paenimyroides tangerinum]